MSRAFRGARMCPNYRTEGAETDRGHRQISAEIEPTPSGADGWARWPARKSSKNSRRAFAVMTWGMAWRHTPLTLGQEFRLISVRIGNASNKGR